MHQTRFPLGIRFISKTIGEVYSAPSQLNLRSLLLRGGEGGGKSKGWKGSRGKGKGRVGEKERGTERVGLPRPKS